MDKKQATNDIRVEIASSNDVQDISRICREGFTRLSRQFQNREKVERVLDEYYNPERILAEIEDASSKWQGWVVARFEEEVVGVAGGGITRTKESYIYDLYLDTDFQKQGIGTRLVNQLTQKQQLVGASKQLIRVLKTNEVGIQFCESLGFRVSHEEEDQEDPDFTEVVYGRSI